VGEPDGIPLELGRFTLPVDRRQLGVERRGVVGRDRQRREPPLGLERQPRELDPPLFRAAVSSRKRRS
jgi:hypothetical protein